MTHRISNFGGNHFFDATRRFQPATEAELVEFLRSYAGRRVRVVGRLHSWSRVLEADDLVVDPSRFRTMHLDSHDGQRVLHAGAGCRIRDILDFLNHHSLTLPTVGLIDRQSIAGAIATGTHGSGRHSISHYVRAVRMVRIDPERKEPKVVRIGGQQGELLKAARCSLGALGIVTEVELPVQPQYSVEEHFARYETLHQVIEQEAQYPLQQFYWVPWRWDFFAQHRRVVAGTSASGRFPQQRSRDAPLYRLYWWLGMDVGFHLLVRALARSLPDACIGTAYRRLIPRLIPRNWKVIDRSDRQLTMKHHLFRHIEVEVFVRRAILAPALASSRQILERFARLSRRERYVHHYPICIRRVLADDAWISPASGDGEDWYSLSFISYAHVASRGPFMAFADELVATLAREHGGRPHWGKVCPVDAQVLEQLYPDWHRFRELVGPCDARDNPFINSWLMGLLE